MTPAKWLNMETFTFTSWTLVDIKCTHLYLNNLLMQWATGVLITHIDFIWNLRVIILVCVCVRACLYVTVCVGYLTWFRSSALEFHLLQTVLNLLIKYVSFFTQDFFVPWKGRILRKSLIWLLINEWMAFVTQCVTFFSR